MEKKTIVKPPKKVANKPVANKPVAKNPVAKKVVAKTAKTNTQNLVKPVATKTRKPPEKKLIQLEEKLPSLADVAAEKSEIIKTKQPQSILPIAIKPFSYFDEVEKVKSTIIVTNKIYPQLLLNSYLYNLSLLSQYQQYLVNKTFKNMENFVKSLPNSQNK